jgi:hypothetical protein
LPPLRRVLTQPLRNRGFIEMNEQALAKLFDGWQPVGINRKRGATHG